MRVGRFFEGKKQDSRILEELRKRAIENKEAPFFGFNQLRKYAAVGTQNLYRQLEDLTKKGYVATTTIGAYTRYYVTKEGVEHNKSLQEWTSFEELTNWAKKLPLEPKQASDPSGTLYYKNISFAKLQSVIGPAWERFMKDVREGLENENCSIGFVGTIKRPERKLSR
jgi:hypothetical protein